MNGSSQSCNINFPKESECDDTSYNESVDMKPKRKKSILRNNNNNELPIHVPRKKSRVSFSKEVDEIFKSDLINQSRKSSKIELRKDKSESNSPDITNNDYSVDMSNTMRTVNLMDVNNKSVIHITQQLHKNYSIINNNTNMMSDSQTPEMSPMLTNKPYKKQQTRSILRGDIGDRRDSAKKKVLFFDKEQLVQEFFLDSKNPESPSNKNKRPQTMNKYDRNVKNRTQTHKSQNPQLLINIYKINNEDEGSKTKRRKSAKSEGVNASSDESIDELGRNDWKKEEYKQLLNDPTYYKIVVDKKFGVIPGFSANSFQNSKDVMEDIINVGINLKLKNGERNASNGQDKEMKHNINVFSIFDGHRGDKAAKELRSSVRDCLLSDPEFITNTKEAIFRTFEKIENKVLEMTDDKGNPDKSGSCAIVIIVIDDSCYVANLGDSRAILSQNLGERVNSLSIDHIPNCEEEKKRIFAKGGFIYLSERGDTNSNDTHQGVYLTKPGRLSVSRSIGDIEVKQEAYGGKPGAIIAIPDIISFKIKEDFDFIIIGSDGLFDKLPHKDITIIVLETVVNCIKSNSTFNQMLVKVTNSIIVEAIDRESRDNISCIFICFDHLYNAFINKSINEIELAIKNLRYSSNEFMDLYDETILRELYEFKEEEEEQGNHNQGKLSKKTTGVFKSNTLKTIRDSNITIKDKIRNQSSVDKPKGNSNCSCLCSIF